MSKHSYEDRVCAVYLGEDPAETLTEAGIVTVAQLVWREQFVAIGELLAGDPWGRHHLEESL